MAAGLTTLRLISRPGFTDEPTAYTTRMLDGLQQRADAAGIPFVTTQAGGMFGLYFSGADAIRHLRGRDGQRRRTLQALLPPDARRWRVPLRLAPSRTGFTSIAHGDKELEITLNAAEKPRRAEMTLFAAPFPAPPLHPAGTPS